MEEMGACVVAHPQVDMGGSPRLHGGSGSWQLAVGIGAPVGGHAGAAVAAAPGLLAALGIAGDVEVRRGRQVVPKLAGGSPSPVAGGQDG